MLKKLLKTGLALLLLFVVYGGRIPVFAINDVNATVAPSAGTSSSSLMDNLFNWKLPWAQGSNSTEMLNWLVQKNLFYYVKWIMVSISIAYLSMYGFLYISSSGKEENITEQHDNLIWALIGFALVGISNLAVNIFAPIKGVNGATKTEIVNTTEFTNAALKVVVFMEYLLGAVAILYMFLGAIRFIMAGGDESIMETEKRNFTWGFLGLMIIMIADIFINVIYNKQTYEFAGEYGKEKAFEQIVGMVNFVLSLMAVVGVLTIVIASIYYVTAIGDEEATKKATNIIKSTLVGFIIISIAYAVVYTFARG